jgi:hypothetical protein
MMSSKSYQDDNHCNKVDRHPETVGEASSSTSTNNCTHQATIAGNGDNTNEQTGGDSAAHRRGAHLSDTSLLSDTFIPNHLKEINLRPITCIIPTHAPPDLEQKTQEIFINAVGGGLRKSKGAFPVLCKCGGNCYDPPRRINVSEERLFAMEQARVRGPSRPISSIDMASSREDYIATFRELLQLEYEEIQRLYDRYSQYQVKIMVFGTGSKTKSKNQNLKVAYFAVPGIADARPALQQGDLVLIRPHCPIHGVSLHHSTSPVQWLHPQGGLSVNPARAHPPPNPIMPQSVEIHARVLSVNRLNHQKKRGPFGKDTVMISWVGDINLAKLLDGLLFTVRFVPSTKLHSRALTALSWLHSIHPIMARDLLFPSESPKLPPLIAINENDHDLHLKSEYDQLNPNQRKFVEMVTTRTAHPINESIRPPLVCTGPAGTFSSDSLHSTDL